MCFKFLVIPCAFVSIKNNCPVKYECFGYSLLFSYYRIIDSNNNEYYFHLLCFEHFNNILKINLILFFNLNFFLIFIFVYLFIFV